MPRVSVITAARDAAPYLAETLDSVFAQTFDDWEAVVADDASTDETPTVARSFGDRVRVVRSERPLGPGGARNLAIAHARGELLATLDSDDMWTPSYLESQVALLDRLRAEGANLGVVCCDARLLGPEGPLEGSYADRTARPRGSITLSDLLRLNVVFTSVLAPRQVIEAVGGYADLPRAQDYDLWVRIAEAGYEIVWNPETLAVYRLRPGSVAAHPERAARSTAVVYERALERGRLDRGQRRLARRQRRLYHLLAQRVGIAEGSANGRDRLRRRLGALPLTALVTLEHPERWLGWLRRGGSRPPGAVAGFR